jgi:hypothetical protein
MGKSNIFVRYIALPQDHGSWVFIISPLLIGTLAAGSFNFATFILIIGAFAIFLLRQPSAILVKANSGRRQRSDMPTALFWLVLYGLVAVLTFVYLIMSGYGQLAWLVIPGIPVFIWHLWLISRRSERRQMGLELIGTGVLALSAPAAYWVSINAYAKEGWFLWLLVWLQNAASIVYAYARLEQRVQTDTSKNDNQISLEKRALAYSSFNLVLTIILGWIEILPQWIFLPFLIQWLEIIWGISHPAKGWKPTKIGIRQMIISTAWTMLFILIWRLT